MTYGKHFGLVIVLTLLFGGFMAYLIIRSNPDKFIQAFTKKPVEEINKEIEIQQLRDSVNFYRKISDRYLEHQLNCVEFKVMSTSDFQKIIKIKKKQSVNER